MSRSRDDCSGLTLARRKLKKDRISCDALNRESAILNLVCVSSSIIFYLITYMATSRANSIRFIDTENSEPLWLKRALYLNSDKVCGQSSEFFFQSV